MVADAALSLPLFPEPSRTHAAPQGAKNPRSRRRTASRQAAPPGAPDPVLEEEATPARHHGVGADVKDFDVRLLAVGRVKGIGVQALRALIDTFDGDLARVWREDTPTVGDVLARARVKDPRKVATEIANRRDELLADAERERDALAAEQVRVLGMHEPAFPRRLAELPDGPYWLFVQGDPSALNAAAHVAIVGTRDSTPLGSKTAERLAHFVVTEGLSIVSGLAEGIDTAAHRVAAYYDVPQVAVLGTGIRHVFPRSTGGLRRRIVAAGGAVITEYLPDESYGKANFVQRNRIQAGLASAVCPVEGRLKGGTAHTVAFAERYGRELFGVYRGELPASNELVKQLLEQGRPVLDLDTDGGVEALRRFLRAIEGPRAPIPSRPAPEYVFRDVLRALDELAADVAITPFDARWLMRRIASRFGLREPDVNESGERNGH